MNTDDIDVKKKNKQGNVVESNEQDGEAFVCVLTSSHLLHYRNLFKTYESILPIKIYMGDKSIQGAIGRGNIQILMIMGDTIVKGMYTYKKT
jgi:hypothetical protein